MVRKFVDAVLIHRVSEEPVGEHLWNAVVHAECFEGDKQLLGIWVCNSAEPVYGIRVKCAICNEPLKVEQASRLRPAKTIH